MWDVFLSYSRGDVEQVRPLARALREGGLTVFTDESGVASFAGISDTIRRELACSRALLAYYSTAYPEREACQWELTTAYLAGLGEGDPRRRVMVVNPEPTTGHIHPVELRDARHAPAHDLAALVADVRAHVARLEGPMTIREHRTGLRGPAGFLGRLPELWQVHSALHAHSAPLVTGRAVARAAQIRGMAGIGKTALAQEYAVRFEAAYPGGVFRLDGEAYDDSLRALGIGRSYEGLEGIGEPFLWIVDSLPAGRLGPRAVADLTPPHPLAHTLFTLRSRAYDALGAAVDLGPLDARHARELAGDEVLAEAVGGHPLALALLGRAVRAGHRPHTLYDRLHARGRSLLDTLAGEEVTARLVHDVTGEDAADVLRCAAALHPLPVTAEDTARVLATADRVPRAVARRRAANGIAELHVRSLLAPAAGPSRPDGGLRGGLRDGRSLLAPAPAAGPSRPDGGLRDGTAADTDAGWQPHPVALHAWYHHDPAPARTEALRRAALRTLDDERAGPVTLAFPGSRREAPMAAPSESERMAAFDLQVELVTRIGVQELAPGTGSLREALTSLKSLIDFTRATLRTYSIRLERGSATGSPTVQDLAYTLVNDVIRPFTAAWHPRLAAHEARRPEGVAPFEHETSWAESDAMRGELAALREPLRRIVTGLGDISGADFGVETAG